MRHSSRLMLIAGEASSMLTNTPSRILRDRCAAGADIARQGSDGGVGAVERTHQPPAGQQ